MRELPCINKVITTSTIIIHTHTHSLGCRAKTSFEVKVGGGAVREGDQWPLGHRGREWEGGVSPPAWSAESKKYYSDLVMTGTTYM